MKTAKLTIGIISMVLFIIIAFQSCAAGLGNALAQNNASDGSAGILLAIFMLVAGIVGVATRNHGRGGALAAAILYLIGGVVGIASIGGIFGDLILWSVVSFAFCLVFGIDAALHN